MMDRNFELFLRTFGPATSSRPAGDGFVADYAGRLPPSLIEFIREQGFAAYAGGLLWTVDPSKYSAYAQFWCDQFSAMAGAEYLVFARSAFGELFAVRSDTGNVVSLAFHSGSIVFPSDIALPLKKKDSGVLAFFTCHDPEAFDIEDEGGEPLFARAIEQLGELDENEMFGFEPALALGGRMSLENLRRLRMDVHLDILAQLAPPKAFES